MRRVRHLANRILQRSIIGGLILFARSALKGARVHPTSRLLGSWKSLRLSSARIGERCIIDIGTLGEILLDGEVWIARDVELQTDGRIHIGSGTTIQRRATVAGNVHIGRDCIIAPNVFISSGTHPFRLKPEVSIREQERLVAAGELPSDNLDRAIHISDDCWLGANVVICPGVVIGAHSVVGANAVVTRDVMPFSVVAGSPARVIGTR